MANFKNKQDLSYSSTIAFPYGGAPENISSMGYPSSGTPIYRDTTEIPPNVLGNGGPTNDLSRYYNMDGVNPEKLTQWLSLGIEEGIVFSLL